jgi:hypothetical protein
LTDLVASVPRTAVLPVLRVAVAASFAFLVATWIARPFVSGDTPFVLDGTNAFLTCLSNHDYNACGYTGKLNYWGLMSPIGWWPLLQHIPDLITIGLGGDGHPARTRVLASLSVAGVIATVGLGWLALRRVGQSEWFWAVMFVLLSGPILVYGRQTAGEALALGLIMALVAATVIPAPPVLVGLAALGACLTKETSYPFIAALGLLGLLLARRRTGVGIRAHVIWGAAGMAITFVAASLFNIVRFGSILNTNYLDSQLLTPGVGRKLEYSFAEFLSPSGGLLFTWPAAVALVVAACVVSFARSSLRSPAVRPALVLILVSAALVFGFASWWTPFGWSGYGPRLQLPWVVPLVLVALVAYGKTLAPLVRRLLSSPLRLLLVFVVALAFTLPHIGYVWKPESLSGYFEQEQPLCEAPWRSGLEEWHDCQSRLLWSARPMGLYTLDGLETLGGAITAVVVAIGLLGSLVLLREELSPVSAKAHATQREAARGARAALPR